MKNYLILILFAAVTFVSYAAFKIGYSIGQYENCPVVKNPSHVCSDSTHQSCDSLCVCDALDCP